MLYCHGYLKAHLNKPPFNKKKKTGLKSVHPFGSYGATDRYTHTDKGQSYNTPFFSWGLIKATLRTTVKLVIKFEFYFQN